MPGEQFTQGDTILVRCGSGEIAPAVSNYLAGKPFVIILNGKYDRSVTISILDIGIDDSVSQRKESIQAILDLLFLRISYEFLS